MTLGERVLLLRRRKKLTQDALALAVGVAKNTISRLEQGGITDVKGQTIAHLARALGVTTDCLLGMTEESASENDREAEPAPRDLVGIGEHHE